MYDQNSSAMWRERIQKELLVNEAKDRAVSREDMRSSIYGDAASSLAGTKAKSQLSMSHASAVSFTSSVMNRIDDLQKQLEEEQARSVQLELELLRRQKNSAHARVFPVTIHPDHQSPRSYIVGE